MEENKKILKKKIVSSVAAASIMLGGIFTPPAQLPENFQDRMTPPAITEMVSPDPVDDDDDSMTALPEEEKKRKGVRQRFIRTLPFLLAIWIAGFILAVIAITSLSVIAARICVVILAVILLLATYTAVVKIFFPDARISQILNWKILLFASALCTGLILLLKGINLLT